MFRFAEHDKDCGEFALPAESSEFLRRLGNKSRANRNGISIVRGTIGHRSIEVIHTGVGENICRERIGKFLENQQFDFLISAGFAGSLNHELQVNDLLVAKNFLTLDLKHAQSCFQTCRFMPPTC